jgi:hypothetical protein
LVVVNPPGVGFSQTWGKGLTPPVESFDEILEKVEATLTALATFWNDRFPSFSATFAVVMSAMAAPDW